MYYNEADVITTSLSTSLIPTSLWCVYIRHVSFFSLSNTLAEYYSRCKFDFSPQIDGFNGHLGVIDRLVQLKIDISRVLITDARISTRIFAVGENDRQ